MKGTASVAITRVLGYAHGYARVTRLRLFLLSISLRGDVAGALALPRVRAAIKFAIFTSSPARRDFENVSQRVLHACALARSRLRSLFYLPATRKALYVAARDIFENNLWPTATVQTFRPRRKEREREIPRECRQRHRSCNLIAMKY